VPFPVGIKARKKNTPKLLNAAQKRKKTHKMPLFQYVIAVKACN
jgi:hypothetical protein